MSVAMLSCRNKNTFVYYLQRARIEDVVVSDQYRGRQLGKFLLVVLTLLAKQMGCYKISLDCKDTMRPFYESLGYNKEDANGNSLVIRY